MATTEQQLDARLRPIPYCVTPFRIVPSKRPGDGRPGFVARWARTYQRSETEARDACAWRPDRQSVRSTMAYLFADVTEVKGDAR